MKIVLKKYTPTISQKMQRKKSKLLAKPLAEFSVQSML